MDPKPRLQNRFQDMTPTFSIDGYSAKENHYSRFGNFSGGPEVLQIFRMMAVGALCMLAPTPAAAQQLAPTLADASGRDPALPVDYYDGLRLSDAGQPDLAMMIWLGAAELGDPRAMAAVSDAYETGKLLPQDRTLANFYFLLARRFGLDDTPVPASAGTLTEAERAAIEQSVASFVPRAAALAQQAKRPHAQVIEAILRGDVASAKAVLTVAGDPGVLLNQPDKDGLSPVGHAAAAGNAGMLEFVLNSGGNLTATFGEGWSLLHLAAANGHLDTAKLLINAGLNAAVVSPKGLTAAEVARKSGHRDLADFLIAAEKEGIRAVQTHLNALGYEVGKPDGVAGARTRTQIGIFASSVASRDKMLTPGVARRLAEKYETEWQTNLWGAVIGYNKGKLGYWSSLNRIAVRSRKAAEEHAMAHCKALADATRCKVEFVMPKGACFALGGDRKQVAVWSPAFPDEDMAKDEAMALCRKQGGGSGCTVLQSACVL